MGYWFLIIFIFIVLGTTIFCACYSKVKEKNTEDFGISVFAVCLSLVFTICFGIDIPDALSGGQKIYVDKFPNVVSMQYCQLVSADGQQFISFSGYNPDKYEQNAEYCITYTKFTKSVLDIKKIEK